MDPAIEQILLGVVSNGLSDFLGRGSTTDSTEELAPVADRAVAEAAKSLTEVPEINPSLGGERLRDFLKSQELHHVIRQIYTSDESSTAGPDIRLEFYELWRVRTGIRDTSAKEGVDRLFDTLVALCEASLDRAIANNEAAALDAKNARRYVALRDSLASVQRTLDVVAGSPELDIDEIESFATEYRRQLASREGMITPPALDTARQFPIDKLYVPARMTLLDIKPEQSLPYGRFASHLYRSVVLGNPGSGKSTLAKKLATDLATERLRLSTVSSGVVPFLVVLRDFGAHKKSNPCSIVDFIALTSNAKYQVRPPVGGIDYLLATNRAVVIFDGLDELLDTSHRAEITGDVESFATLFPSVPLLVTSREVGYEQAPLSQSRFATFRLDEFTTEQAHQYAKNWFSVGVETTPDTATEQADQFMEDSSSVMDLRANALMLGLMCNLYKGSGYIPRNRPDVYEACAEMLFDRWDRLRQIKVGLTIESLIRPTMQHLALWIYQDPELQSGVTERTLIEEASEYLLGRRFDTSEDAKLEARRFIEFCRGRAWVFTDTGTTSAGERLYQFTHRTFLEFFAASALIRTYSAPGDLLEVLKPRIATKEWDVVAQLAFQLLERNVDGAANSLLTELISKGNETPESDWLNCVDFAVRSLAFLVPAPSVTREITAASVTGAMQWAQAEIDPAADELSIWMVADVSGTPVDSTMELLRANPENLKPIQASLSYELQAKLKSDATAPFAAELGLNMRLKFDARGEAAQVAREVKKFLIAKEPGTLCEIAGTDAGLAADLFREELLPAKALIAAHGLRGFLIHRRHKMFPGRGRVPVSQIVLATVLWGTGKGRPSEGWGHQALAELAEPLSSQDPPWYTPLPESGGSLWGLKTYDGSTSPALTDISALTSEQRFALATLVAVTVEEAARLPRQWAASRRVEDIVSKLDDAGPMWSALGPIFRAKLGIGSMQEASERLRDLQLPASGESMLSQWLNGTLSLVAVDSTDEEEPDQPQAML